jgi:hypothetical protein
MKTIIILALLLVAGAAGAGECPEGSKLLGQLDFTCFCGDGKDAVTSTYTCPTDIWVNVPCVADHGPGCFSSKTIGYLYENGTVEWIVPPEELLQLHLAYKIYGLPNKD